MMTSALLLRNSVHAAPAGLRLSGLAVASPLRHLPYPFPPRHAAITPLSHPRRPFSAAAAADAAVQLSQDAFVGVHALTGTPWFVTIPLSALFLTAVTRIPGTLYTHRLALRRERHKPLLAAWVVNIRKNVAETCRHKSPEAQDKEVEKRFYRNAKRMWARLGLQDWRLLAPLLLALPVWFLAIDGLRRLCSARTGLFSWLTSLTSSSPPPPSETASAVVTAVPNGAATEPALAGAASASAAPAAESAAATAAAVAPDAASVASDAASVASDAASSLTIDASMVTEGCLWFTDLTAPDPYHVLPVILTAVLTVATMPKDSAGWRRLFSLPPKQNGASSGANIPPRFSKTALGVQRLGMIFAVSACFITVDFPAALLLYWITSSASNTAFRRLLHHRLPLSKIPQPMCRGRGDTMFVKPPPLQAAAAAPSSRAAAATAPPPARATVISRKPAAKTQEKSKPKKKKSI